MLQGDLRLGAYNAICDVCGHQFKNYELFERWDGQRVCRLDFEKRHATDLFNPTLDEKVPRVTSPEPEDQFQAGPACTIEGRQDIAGVGTAGCITLGFRPVLT